MNSLHKNLLIFLIFTGVSLRAGNNDILTFTNGDSLRGQLVEETEDYYIFESDNLGTLRIVRSAVSTVTLRLAPESESPTLELAVETPAETEHPADAPTLTAVVTPVVTFYQSTLDPLLSFLERVVNTFDRIYPLSHWNNRIDVGLIFQSGDLDKMDYQFNFRTELNDSSRPTSVLYTFRREYGWQRNNQGQSTVTRNRINSTLRHRYSYAERYFIQLLTQYDRRVEQGVLNDIQLNAGLGYRFLHTDAWTGSITPSFGVRYRQFRERESDGSFSLGLLQDMSYTVNTSLRLTQQLNLSLDPTDKDDFTANLQTSVENRLTERVWLNIRYEVLYNGNIPAGTQPTQHTVSFGVGTQF